VAEILSDSQLAFLEANHSAAMATVDDRGRPHAVPVLCALVDLRLYRAATGRDPDDLEEYRAAMVAERRLVYVLTPERVHPSPR